ncbi:MAG: heme-binding domain-containing protein [Vicinamibacterales bacterium]
MNRLIRYAVLAGLGVLVAMQFIRPARTNPATEPSRTLGATMSVPASVQAVLDRSCRDCHSNDTRWPWYSNLAPMSWMVIDHVNSGRRHFNYSEWATYTPDTSRKVLHDICEETRQGSMPVGSYTLVHREARLSEADIQTLCAWTASALAPVVSHGR